MPRTVDTSSTLENFRVEHNNLATDIGAIGNLTTGDTSSVVNAINYIMDQYFFFQDFDYDGSDGATSNTVFSGADNAGNTLQYSAGKVLVYKNGLLLRNGTDYTATNGTSITLASSANNSDVVRISSYTGSYQNVGAAASTSADQWVLAGGVLHNKNTGGIVINADSSTTTTVGTSEVIELQGNTHQVGHFNVKSVGSNRNEVRLFDNDNSNYVGLRSPASISSNFTLALPDADGTAGYSLVTDGSGSLTWAAAGTAPDITISANNSANETVFPVFVDGATGAQTLESDSGFTYNPSTGRITSTEYSGNVILATQNSITTMTQLNTVGTIGSGTWQGTAIARAYIANDAIDATKIDDNAVGAAALNISGNGSSGQVLLSDGDGSFSYGTGGKTTEEIQDITGAMFSSNTETGISATYEDGDGTIDLVIGNDVIVQSMIADNAIDSQHYVDGSIDTAHIADNQITAAKLNIPSDSGRAGQGIISDGDGSFNYGNAGFTTEQVQDIVGAMFTSNTETRISATYEDGDATIDLVVDDMTADTNTQLSNAQVRTAVEAASDSNVFTDADHSKLNGIEASATADQSNAEIKAAVEAASDSNTFTDADHTKLNGIAANATATNATDQNFTTALKNKLDGIETSATADQTSVSGNAGTATTLQTARTIGGVSFNGSANINLPGVNAAGTQNTTGRANEVLVNNIGTNSAYNVLFHVGSDTVAQDSGSSQFTYNPSTNLLHIGGSITSSGDITAFLSSDVAFKENISPISQALEKVGLISGYEFDWKDHKDPQVIGKGHDVGIIAQEVEKVLPEVVTTRENGKKAVNYQKIIPLLIESIKELKSELDDLKSSNS